MQDLLNVLAAVSRCVEHVYLEVFIADLYVNLFGFGQNRYGGG